MRSFRLIAVLLGTLAAAACGQRGASFAPSGGAPASVPLAVPDTASASVIYRFKGGRANPDTPTGGLAVYHGKLFGTASQNGYGLVYTAARTPAGWAVKSVYRFSSPSVNGSGPYGVIASANGTLFGATGSGGTYTSGILYMLVPSGRSYKQKVLHSMTGSDGTEPGLLAMDKAGALYGSAIYGGSGGALCGTAGCGVVFKLTPSAGGSYSYSVLRNFAGGADGIGPMGRLAIASNGTLYGATIEGGVATAQCQQGCGTIFSLTPSGRAYRYKVLYRFRGGADGEYPMGGVVVGATAATQSQLFGVTSGGGDVAECYTPQSVPGCGTVYAFASGKKTTLYGFRGYTFNDGEIPAAGLTATATGLLGTTSLGGNQTAYNSVGTIWSIAYSGTGYTTLHNFDGVEYGTDGRSPDSPLTQFGNAYVTSIQQGGGSKACGFYGCGVLVALTL